MINLAAAADKVCKDRFPKKHTHHGYKINQVFGIVLDRELWG